jgi:hypothetical protein
MKIVGLIFPKNVETFLIHKKWKNVVNILKIVGWKNIERKNVFNILCNVERKNILNNLKMLDGKYYLHWKMLVIIFCWLKLLNSGYQWGGGFGGLTLVG